MRCWPTRSAKAHGKISKLYCSDLCEEEMDRL
jgi:hypothetical protein